jgi:hypothetical protein
MLSTHLRLGLPNGLLEQIGANVKYNFCANIGRLEMHGYAGLIAEMRKMYIYYINI